MGCRALGLLAALGVSLALVQPAAGARLYEITVDHRLATMDWGGTNLSFPSEPRAITGIPAGFLLIGLTTRPLTGELYVLGLKNFEVYQIYRLDPTTATLSPVGPARTISSVGSAGGFEFDAATDLIRWIPITGENFRISPVTGQIVARDANVVYTSGNFFNAPYVAGLANSSLQPGIPGTAYTFDPAVPGFGLLGKSGDPASAAAGKIAGIGKPAISPYRSVAFEIADDGTAFVGCWAGLSNHPVLFTANLQTGSVHAVAYLEHNGEDLEPRAIASASTSVAPTLQIHGRKRVAAGSPTVTLRIAAADVYGLDAVDATPDRVWSWANPPASVRLRYRVRLHSGRTTVRFTATGSNGALTNAHFAIVRADAAR